MQVLDFIKWGLTHVKKSTVPSKAILPIPYSKVGSAGEWEYLFGTTGIKVTESLLKLKFSSYYSKHGWTKEEFDKATKGWIEKGVIACDCQGVEDYYSKSDTNANGNYVKYCTDKGLCSAIKRPYILGEAVFNGTDARKNHVGWVCGFMPDGDVLVMEERGLSYGFVVTRMSKRPWMYRGLMTKRYTYDKRQSQPDKSDSTFIFTRILKYGCSGDDVKELKKTLARYGYTGLTLSNANFYESTKKMVKKFQSDHDLTVDGIVGPKTYSALKVKYKKQ